jgi:histidyl-tRNA synthetase
LSKQFKLAEKSEADVGIFVGEEELGNGNVTIKQLGLGDTDDGEIVKRANMVEYIKNLLQNLKERPR